ncbi:MAG: membrane-bound PQQ-dependent dehydrogenase, glucose/quinate/shikimate family [Novosphingobium sp.]
MDTRAEAGVRARGKPRVVLAIILGLIALALVIGGAQLALLGGTIYYLLAGLAVAAAAWFALRGDRRAMAVYALMLVGTFVWALWEGGLNPWSLQSRLVAPLVLAVWVFWPWIRPWRTAFLGVVAIVALAFGGWLWSVNRPETAPLQKVAAAPTGAGEWRQYGNVLAGTRFSPLTQINQANVNKLEPAWTYRTGVLQTGLGFEATPLMVDDTLYLCTTTNVIIALDPETGARRWQYDPKVNAPPAGACRGVSYYEVPDATGTCAKRIVSGTVDGRLIEVDAVDGKPCADFGENGAVNLKKGLGDVISGYYYISSAPTIVRGKIVVGGWVADGQFVGEPSGVIRAYDAVTGDFVWAWDMDRPHEHGEPGPGETYSRGTANSWGPMSGDEELGMVYLPTGNSTPDYWGAHRSKGSEKYSAGVVALDIETGEARWNFQIVHHDVWDYDVSPQPTLIDMPIDGKIVPALVQTSKSGQMFLLDRRDGKPLKRVEERPVPQGPAPGDWLSPTQPFSPDLPAFDNTVLTPQIMWGLTPIDQMWCRIKFGQARYEGIFTPPGYPKPSITYPSFLGGVNWGGIAVNPGRKLAIVNWNRMANYTSMVSRKDADAMGLKRSDDGVAHVGLPVPQEGTPFGLLTGAFLSPLGVPCTEPPFGKIGVVDLESGKMLWEKPLGTGADSGPFDIKSHIPLPMGVPVLGGPMTTGSGLIFIAATQERALRAFDLDSGKMLWRAQLPVGGHSTPMTYISPKSGRQFVVVSAGGSASLATGVGDYVMAFALPEKP